jgi:hypothetical protein
MSGGLVPIFLIPYWLIVCPIGAIFQWDCSSGHHMPRAWDDPKYFIGKPLSLVAEVRDDWELTDSISHPNGISMYRYTDREHITPRAVILTVEKQRVVAVAEHRLAAR